MKVIEKIRAMSTEEVAEVLYKMEDFGGDFDEFCKKKLVTNELDELRCPFEADRCKECIKEWLESEVEK